MKITKVDCHRVHPGWRKNWIFVKLSTDAGITGWGEVYSQYDRDGVIATHVKELTRYLIGRDPFDSRYFCRMAFDDYAQRRGSVEFYSAISGIEAAMWDIVGKACGQPVWRLLGGKQRDRIRVYANGWSYKIQDPAGYAEAAKRTVELGYTALKLDPLPRPWRTYIPPAHFDHACRVMEAVREAVGPDVDLLLDIHRRLSARNAITLGRMLRPFRPYWFEEPCPSVNIEALREVREAVDIPVVTGEATYAKAEFANILRARAVDIVNPDVANCGGITEILEIAAMAEAEMVAISPHNYNSTTLALSATVHASLCMPNFIITEYFIPFEEVGRKIAPNALVPKDGYISPPEEPGLGITIDERDLQNFPYKPFPARKLPFPEDELS